MRVNGRGDVEVVERIGEEIRGQRRPYRGVLIDRDLSRGSKCEELRIKRSQRLDLRDSQSGMNNNKGQSRLLEREQLKNKWGERLLVLPEIGGFS